MPAADLSTRAAQPPSGAVMDGPALAAALPMPVILVDAAGGVTYANPAAVGLLGKGRRVEELFTEARMGPGFPGWGELVAGVLRSGTPARTDAYFAGHGDAAARVLSLTLTAIMPGAGKADRIGLLTVEDVSWRAGLEQRLATHERLASLGKLAARVAHELNNPLDGILRYINLALRLIGSAEHPKVHSYLQESRTGLMRMTQIIRDLLEFSRAGHGQFDIASINDIVEQAVREYSSKAAEHRVIVTADYQDDQLPGVHGSRLYQVCCNLIKNAIEAMPDGGRLAITTGRAGEWIVIRVADTGPGLPADTKRLFEPFFTTKPAGQGTGLGLAICREYLEDLGGSVEATSGEDGGAVFTVRLPQSACHELA